VRGNMIFRALRAISGQDSFGRWQVLLLVTLGLALVLLAGIVLRALGEAGGSNSYALLAEAFLNGRLHVEGCFDYDCATFQGKTYVFFPPFPALLITPFIAVFGKGFAGFVLLGALMGAAALWLWRRILGHYLEERADVFWFLLAIAFATPLYYLMLRGDGVWFFAQITAFLLVTAALYQTLFGRRLWVAGLFIGLAFLSRQLSLLYLPFLFALVLRDDEPLISFQRKHIVRVLQLGLPVAGAVLVYLVYNYVRFGDPFETGYTFMVAAVSDNPNFIEARMAETGLFSKDYFLFNVLYLFFQGLHVEFGGRYLMQITGVDPLGTSIIAASPFVLLLFFAPARRELLMGFFVIAMIICVHLFYHSNGFSQYNAQRYALDWLPIAFMILACSITAQRSAIFRLLVAYAMALNVVAAFALAMVHGA